MERDPAAKSRLEIYLLYPGFKALRSHRRAHKHYLAGRMFLARLISQQCLRNTGIEIHPGAVIGKNLVIDHGTGVVIGETAEIGDDCIIYQGVTLGGTGKEQGKRHPTLGNNVIVGAGARVLGPFHVGDNSKIAAGAVVLSEVPPNSTVVGVPARIVKQNGERTGKSNAITELDQIHFPDPVAAQIDELIERVDSLTDALSEVLNMLNNKEQ